MNNTDGKLTWKYTSPFGRKTGYEDIVDKLNIYDAETFKDLPLDEQISLAHKVLEIIRQVNVYPVYYLTDPTITLDIMECLYEDVQFNGNVLDVNSPTGTTLLDFMFPSLHLTNAGGSKNNSMYDRFFDDNKLTRCLVGYMRKYQFGSVRTMFFMYGRLYWATATGFTPMRAKAIYDRFCKPGYVVYDSSAGFGGRMLGALSSTKQLTYIACEPNTMTYNSLLELGSKINIARQKFGIEPANYQIHHIGSEEFTLEENSVDFAFTCPPYYKLERYCDEPTQSTLRFPKYEDWLEGFATKTLQNTYSALKPGADMCTVIGNMRDSNNRRRLLIDDWITCAEKVGFKYVQSYQIKTRSRKDEEDAERILHFIKEA